MKNQKIPFVGVKPMRAIQRALNAIWCNEHPLYTFTYQTNGCITLDAFKEDEYSQEQNSYKHFDKIKDFLFDNNIQYHFQRVRKNPYTNECIFVPDTETDADITIVVELVTEDDFEFKLEKDQTTMIIHNVRDIDLYKTALLKAILDEENKCKSARKFLVKNEHIIELVYTRKTK